jgi:hypothetical protein
MATTPASPPVPHTALPSTRSLPDAAQAAAQLHRPLVVMTTLKGCPYCDVVRGHYLLPMQRSGQIQAIQLDMTDRATPIKGFDGRPTTAAALVKAWQAKLAPTVLFLGPKGEELAERLVGMAVPDMYGSYLDRRLDEARQHLAVAPRL